MHAPVAPVAGVEGVAAVVDDAVVAEPVEGLPACDQAVVVLVQQQLHLVGVGLALRPSQLHQVRVEGLLHLRLREGVDEDADGRILLLEDVDGGISRRASTGRTC